MGAQTQIWWETARAAGICLGPSPPRRRRRPPAVDPPSSAGPPLRGLSTSTRFVAGLAVSSRWSNMVRLLDPFIGYGLRELLVPYTSAFEPPPWRSASSRSTCSSPWMLTSLAMRKLPRPVWHGVHLSSYLLFVFATVHGITAGTDRHNALLQWDACSRRQLVPVMTLVRILAPAPCTDRSSPTAERPTRHLHGEAERPALHSADDRPNLVRRARRRTACVPRLRIGHVPSGCG